MAARRPLDERVSVRRLYAGLARRLPRRVVARLEAATPVHPFALAYRRALRRAVAAGPPYRPSYESLVVDVTTRCNLRCVDCNRSCGSGQRRPTEDLPLEAVDRLIADSVARNHRWRTIQLEGGEPTLHPGIEEIVRRLLAYIAMHAAGTHLTLVSNRHGAEVRRIGEHLAALGVDVQGEEKRTPQQPSHCAFNVAPCDMPEMAGVDLSDGCHLPVLHGLGLCPGGFYAHPVCGGIDRVHGLGLGRPRLPESGDPLEEQFSALCRLCGCFRMGYRMRGGHVPVSEEALRGQVSPAWRAAYAATAPQPLDRVDSGPDGHGVVVGPGA